MLIKAFLIVATTLFGQAEYSLYVYRSDNGTAFSDQIELIDSSDVPSIAQDSAGTILCLFQCFKGGQASPNWGTIGSKRSYDNGISWSMLEYINITGLTGTNQRAFDPTITITPDNKYRLYFSYCPNTLSLDSTCDTHSAISDDGINYVLEPGVRFGADDAPVIDPAAVYFNSMWHYTAPITPPDGGARHANSSDGLAFTLLDSLGTGDTHYHWTGNLINDGFSMRFYGFTDNVFDNHIWWSESADGSSWSDYNFTNITGKDPGIAKLMSGKFVMVVPKNSSEMNNVDAVDPIINAAVIYPNPLIDQSVVKLLTNNKAIWSWTLYNSIGQSVDCINNIETEELLINRGLFNPGVYMYFIESEGNTIRGKLLIH